MRTAGIIGRAATALVATLTVTTAAATVAAAQPKSDARSDGYCDTTLGIASAQSALLLAPQVFASLGYLDQQAVVDTPGGSSDDLRLTAGVKYQLSGVYEGILTRRRASADCKRHTLLGQVQGGTAYRALEARAKVLDDALKEAETLFTEAAEDLERRRATAQEVNATRLRVDELRELAAATRRELASLPPPSSRPMANALAAYRAADADVERHDASLRRAQAWDVSVRFGYDKFVSNDDDENPYFAVVSVGVNLGWFFQGSGNARAARGRRAQLEHGGGDATASRLRAALIIDRQRAADTAVLVADLERQLGALRGLEGDNSRRYRQTVWFEWVKIKADHEFLAAHVAALREVLGDEPEAGE